MPVRVDLSAARYRDSFRQVGDWKRFFFKHCEFRDVDDLLRDVAAGGPSTLWVQEVLSLRYLARHRHSVDDVRDAVNQGAAPQWLSQLRPRLWALYRMHKELNHRDKVQEHHRLRTLTISQRQLLHGLGVVRCRRTRAMADAVRNMDILTVEAGSKSVVQWVDNYSRQRYSRSPHENRDQSINGTARAVLPLPVRITDWRGWPSLQELYDCIPRLAAQCRMHTGIFGDDIRQLLMKDFGHADVRVPCDVTRDRTESVPWYPYAIDGDGIGGSDGLALAVQRVLDVASRFSCIAPVVVDVNIFYRILKLLYSETFARLNLRGAMYTVPFCFGVWHSYVHCVRRTHHVFHTVWSILEYGQSLCDARTMDTVRVYSFPKVYTLEYMITTVFLVDDRCRRRVRQLMKEAQDAAPGSIQHSQALLLYLFVEEYVPALMLIGIRLRDLYWVHRQWNTGHFARDVQMSCFVYLHALESRVSTQYLRGIACSLMLWDKDLHGVLPASVYVEEAMEASLSRLSRQAGTDLRSTTVEQFSDMYVAMGPATDAGSVSKTHVRKSFIMAVQARCDVIITAIQHRRLPFVKPSLKEKYSTVHGDWVPVEELHVPKRLKIPTVDSVTFACTLSRTFRTLLLRKTVDDKNKFLSIAYRAPPLTSTFQEARIQFIQSLIQQLLFDERNFKKGTRMSACFIFLLIPAFHRFVS